MPVDDDIGLPTEDKARPRHGSLALMIGEEYSNFDPMSLPASGMCLDILEIITMFY